MSGETGRVSVVVIVYNDAEHVVHAVRSALTQGDAVFEVVVVDDASTDDTPHTLLSVFADEDRVRVLRREHNSGGCGSPRNDGLAATNAPYVMFLDSDDQLLPGAVDALLAATETHDADAAVGRCLRRELPSGESKEWLPHLFDRPLVLEGIDGTDGGDGSDGLAQRTEQLQDTLSVNKLYRREFLTKHDIHFPGGSFHYEDFVFAARLYAAAPRLAITDTPVYLWHVRRQAPSLSISLRRAKIANWEHRVAAHQQSVEIFRDAGRPELAAAAQGKFLDYDLPMYARELPLRTDAYRADWWRVTRDYLSTFDAEGYAAARIPSRWLGRAIEALPDAAEAATATGHLVELAARPPRLVPPYHRSESGTPVLGTGPLSLPLEGLGELTPQELPIAVDAEVTIGSDTRLALRVHDLYGRLAALRPQSVRVILGERSGARPDRTAETTLEQHGDSWTASVRFHTGALAGPGGGGGGLTAWSVTAEVRCADGQLIPAGVRAPDPRQARRRVVIGLGRPLLVQVHVALGAALVLRVADGVSGVRHVAAARLRRLLRRFH